MRGVEGGSGTGTTARLGEVGSSSPLSARSRTLPLNIAYYDSGWVNFELKPLEGARLPAPPILEPAMEEGPTTRGPVSAAAQG